MIILDTSFLIALKHSTDVNHNRALELQKDLLNNVFGSMSISDYIFDEFITFTRKKIMNQTYVEQLGEHLLFAKNISLYRITQENFLEAWDLFKIRKNLSFTDATTIILAKQLGVKYICSFDSDFTGFEKINRIC
jgi:predicted nucleic acid-binding protein